MGARCCSFAQSGLSIYPFFKVNFVLARAHGVEHDGSYVAAVPCNRDVHPNRPTSFFPNDQSELFKTIFEKGIKNSLDAVAAKIISIEIRKGVSCRRFGFSNPCYWCRNPSIDINLSMMKVIFQEAVN